MNRILSTTTLTIALLGAALTALDADAASRRVVRTDGQGDASVVSAGAVRGPNGASAARAGTTTRNADGSATHRSGFEAQGAKGSVESVGSATRAADGSVTQSRTTSATNAATGNSATTTGSYSPETGRTRTTTCYNAAGASVACPGKP